MVPRDWPQVTDFPVFGFPHIVEDDAIVVGSEPAPFFDALVAMARPQLSWTDRNDLDDVYGEPVDMGCFSDLLAVHELGHLFHVQSGFWFPQRADGRAAAFPCVRVAAHRRRHCSPAQTVTGTNLVSERTG